MTANGTGPDTPRAQPQSPLDLYLSLTALALQGFGGVLMVVQNRMMPNTMDPAQAKLMRWMMPVMFTLFMLFLPSGLAVYIFANILLSIVQTAVQVGVRGNDQAAPST